MFEARAAAAEVGHRERAWLAWHAGYLARIPVDRRIKFPTLAEVTGGKAKAPAPRRFNDNEWRAFLLRLEARAKAAFPDGDQGGRHGRQRRHRRSSRSPRD